MPSAGAPIDFADPDTYNNATSLTVYDAKGQDVALTYYFQKAATDTWNVFVADAHTGGLMDNACCEDHDNWPAWFDALPDLPPP